MTRDEIGKAVTDNQLIDKLVSRLAGNYPKYKDWAQDIAQGALVRVLKTPGHFEDVPRLTAYLFEKAEFDMIDCIRKDVARRKISKRTLMVVGVKSYNPTRHLDWKIDLERGITKVTHDVKMRQALWANVFERATWDEILETPGLSRVALADAKNELKREMRRKGYRI